MELSDFSTSLSSSAAAVAVAINITNEIDLAVDLAASAIGSQHSTTAKSRKDRLHCLSGDAVVSPAPSETAISSGSNPGGIDEADHAVIDEIGKLDLKVDDADVAVEPLAPAAVEEVVEAVEVEEEEEEEKCEGGEISENSEDEAVIDEGENDVDKKKGGENERRRQYPVRPEAEDCVFYLKTGACKFGSNCKFNHPVRRKSYNQFQGFRDKVKERDEFSDNKPSQTECKYYSGPGGCKYGKGCRYIHGKGKNPVAPVEELNFLGLPIRQGERECPYYMRTGSCKFGTNCKYNHPDPTAAGGSDPPSGFVDNNGPTPLQGGLQPSSWTAPRSLNETPPYVPMMMPPSQGVPSQNLEWNGYPPVQAPFYSDRGMPAPPPYVINNSVIETNVYKQYPQSNQVDEFPERPGQPLCSFYLRTGDCKFRSNCKYHHPKSQTAVSPPFALSDKGLPLRPDQNICIHYSRYGICKFGPACKYDHPSGLDHRLPFSDLANTREAGIAGNTSRTDDTIHL